MIAVSNADRIVFPEIGHTKGDVVAYYERIAPLALFHVIERPLSIRRFPKGLAGPGFFQKNVPAHYPDSIGRLEVPRSRAATKKHPRKGGKDPDVTVYPFLRDPEHLAYLANQGAIELHVPTARLPALDRPDRVIIDLDPPSGAASLARRAAQIIRDALGVFGLATVPLATGSKGYHLVSPIRPFVPYETLSAAVQKLAMLLAAQHPDVLTTTFRIAGRHARVFVDWLRNQPNATAVAPYSLRARPRATVATPLTWDEFERMAPDSFTIDDIDQILDRPDSIADLSQTPGDGERFVAAVGAAFEEAALKVETFDRFR